MIRFALTVPRPLVWLLAHGVVRDLTLASDPSALVGQVVALFSGPHGDHQGYRHLARVLSGTDLEGTTVAQVREECPKRAVVGIATVATVVPEPHGWRVHLEDAKAVHAVPLPAVEPEVWVLPPGTLSFFPSAAPNRGDHP